MIATEHPHIARDPAISGGEPVIKGTRISVAHIVALHGIGESPETIQIGLPHLSLAQIYDALSFYYDHREEIDALIRKCQ